MNRDEVYDWQVVEDAPRVVSGEVVRRPGAEVNPVNGHGRGCECAQCPGWYDRRAALGVPSSPRGVVPAARETRPLLDQVIPVCCLLATITVCGLVLLPVIVPVLAISAVMVIALAVTVCGGAVAVVYAIAALRREAARGSGVKRWRQ